MIKAKAWKTTQEKNATECFYRIQVYGVKNASERKIAFDALKDWESVAEGWNNKKQEEVLVFRKNFETVEHFLGWGKEFMDFPLEEIDKNGKIKAYVKIGPQGKSRKTKSKPKNTNTSKPQGRVCGKCGERGHNARTCRVGGSTIVSENKNISVKKQRRCGKCGEYGHNRATCRL